jgi:hypothetical protein
MKARDPEFMRRALHFPAAAGRKPTARDRIALSRRSSFVKQCATDLLRDPDPQEIPMSLRFAINTASALAMCLLLAGSAGAQQPAPAPAAPPAADAAKGTFLLTIFLKHDQSKSLDQIQSQLRSQGFYKAFPPPNIEVVSWYVMMGIGQVVTLRVPAERLREVNRAIEQTAWGGYRTEFYPTYDYKAIGEDLHAKAQSQ